MPMVDVYAAAGPFPDPEQPARELAARLKAIEQVSLCSSITRTTSGMSPAASTAALWNGQPRTEAGAFSIASSGSKIARRRSAAGSSVRSSCRSDSRASAVSNRRRYSSMRTLFDSSLPRPLP